MDVELPPPMNRRLADLAARLGREPGTLVAIAVDEFIERELRTVAAIERGLAEAKAGRTTPHDEVMAAARDRIRAAMETR